MALRFSCPECGANLAVPDGFAGRKGVCKKCGADVAVPYAPATAVPSATRASLSGKEPKETASTVEVPLSKGYP